MKLSSQLSLLFLLFVLQVTYSQEQPSLVLDAKGHSGTVTDVLFASNGKVLITVSNDKTIRFWDIEAGTILRTLRGQFGPGIDGMLYASALSPDGVLYAIGGYPAKYGIRVFNLESGDQDATLKGATGGINDLAFSPDGKYLAAGISDNTVRIWKTNDNNKLDVRSIAVLEQHSAPVYNVAFSPDSKQLVSCSLDGTLNLWNIEDMNAPQLIATMQKHEMEVRCVAYSPDGKYIVSGGFDYKILLWDNQGNFIKEIDELQGSVNTLSFSEDGSTLLAMSKNGTIYNIPEGEKLLNFTEHDNVVTASDFFENQLIATAGGDNNDIIVWNADNGEVVKHLVGKGRTTWATAFGEELQVAFGTISEPVAYNERGPLTHIFDFKKLEMVEKEIKPDIFIRANEEYGERHLEKEDSYTLSIIKSYSSTVIKGTEGRINCYTFTKEGQIIVGCDFSLEMYDNRGTFLRRFVGHSGAVWAVSVSSDGKYLTSGSDDQTLKLWYIETGECLATLFFAADKQWICWSPQGYYTSSAKGETYIGWHVNKGVDHLAEFYTAKQYRKKFKNPEVLKRIIELGSFDKANEEIQKAKK